MVTVRSVRTLHFVVKNGDGSVNVGVIVTADPPGSALSSFASASIGFSPANGEKNRLLQPAAPALMLLFAHMS